MEKKKRERERASLKKPWRQKAYKINGGTQGKEKIVVKRFCWFVLGVKHKTLKKRKEGHRES